MTIFWCCLYNLFRKVTGAPPSIFVRYIQSGSLAFTHWPECLDLFVSLQEVEDLEEGETEKVPKVSKKKLPKVEENKSKKEHINVVFIGHVGESLL